MVPATAEFFDTQVNAVAGQWTLNKDDANRAYVGASGEEGTANREGGCSKAMPSANNGELLLLQGQQTIAIGSNISANPDVTSDGHVYFMINDCPGEFGNNAGEMLVWFVVIGTTPKQVVPVDTPQPTAIPTSVPEQTATTMPTLQPTLEPTAIPTLAQPVNVEPVPAPTQGPIPTLVPTATPATGDSKLDYGAVPLEPPAGVKINIYPLVSMGWTARCKGFIDPKFGDFLIRVKNTKNARADKMHIWYKPNTPSYVVEATKFEDMSFLGVTTKNARLCFGLRAAVKAYNAYTVEGFVGNGFGIPRALLALAGRGAGNFTKYVYAWSLATP